VFREPITALKATEAADTGGLSMASDKGQKLAIDGGKPVRTEPFPARTPFGDEEAGEVLDALRSQNLFYPTGKKVYEFVNAFSELYGVRHVVPSTSGTSAIHVAVGTVNPEPGDEIIVTPISDMGSVAPIVLCNAVPVFADVEIETFNIDPDEVADKITDRTKAIIAVHCLGRPVRLDEMLRIARERDILLIEDCSQSHMVRHKGRLTGTIGDFGTFSFQQSKHMTCGDGGLTIINCGGLAARAEIYVDKGCDWTEGRKYRKQYAFFAPCYRMTELQGAVLLAQVRKLESVVRRRQELGSMLSNTLQGIHGVRPAPPADAEFGHGYWSFPIRIVEEELGVGRDKFREAMAAEGVSGGAWLGKPLYEFDSMMNHVTFGKSGFPFVRPGGGKPPEYGPGLCPNAEKAMSQLFCIGLNENWTESDVEDAARAVKKVAALLPSRREANE